MKTSRITTEQELMALEPNTKVYLFSNGNMRFWNVLGKVPYRTLNYMALYEGTDTLMIGKHSLKYNRLFTDHDEAYQFFADHYRERAESIERIYLKKDK